MRIPGLYITPEGRIEFTFSGLSLSIAKGHVTIAGDTMTGFSEVYDRIGSGGGLIDRWRMRSTREVWEFKNDGTIVMVEENGDFLDSGLFVADLPNVTLLLRRACFQEFDNEIRFYDLNNGEPEVTCPFSISGAALTIEYPGKTVVYTRES